MCRHADSQTHPDLTINCSAIAKGAGRLDRGVFDCTRHERYLIEIGGEIRTAVPESDPNSWTVGIRKPKASLHSCRLR